MNSIASLKTVELKSERGAVPAIMVAVNIHDRASANVFAAEVIEKVVLQRMISPPNTELLLISVIGDVDITSFADSLRAAVAADPAMAAFMSMMTKADVVQGTADGKILATLSLLTSTTPGKPWWRFW